MRLNDRRARMLGAALAALGWAGVATAQKAPTPPPDMPAVTGPSGTSGNASDRARTDAVGYAEVRPGLSGIAAVSAALPPGSFAEVTALDGGRTILVAIAPGAPAPGRLAALSPEAARLLGVSGSAVPVRVRAVDPIAADQVALRQGRPAAARLDAPPILLTGLKAQLPAAPPAIERATDARPTHRPTTVAAGEKPPATHLKPPVAAKAPSAAKSVAAPAAHGDYAVQVATFASHANATALAGCIGGHVRASGKYWRVELGPYVDAAAANRARDGVAKRGYGDARVVHAD